MGNRYGKSAENEKILYIDANRLFGWAMSEFLPEHEIEMWHKFHIPDIYMNKLEEISNTSYDSDIGFLLEVDLKHPESIKGETKKFPPSAENKVVHKDKFNDYIQNIKPKTYTKAKKLICD